MSVSLTQSRLCNFLICLIAVTLLQSCGGYNRDALLQSLSEINEVRSLYGQQAADARTEYGDHSDELFIIYEKMDTQILEIIDKYRLKYDLPEDIDLRFQKWADALADNIVIYNKYGDGSTAKKTLTVEDQDTLKNNEMQAIQAERYIRDSISN